MIQDKNVEAFNIKSDEYEFARPTYPDELFEVLSKECRGLDKAWDCACGTGQVSKSLVNYFTEVHATDINKNQILNSYKDPSINFSVQKSEETTFEDSYFDLVCVAQAMHWFDIDKYFKEVNRVLKPGGIFACWGYSFFSISPEIDTALKKTLLDPVRPYWSERNKILWSKYKDVSFPFKKIETPDIVMKQTWSKEELISYVKTWSAYRRFEEFHNKDIELSIMDSIKSIWSESSKKKVVMDFNLYIGRKEFE